MANTKKPKNRKVELSDLSWARAISMAQTAIMDKVPKGFKTTEQLCDEMGMSRTYISVAMQVLKKLGAVEEKSFRIRTRKGTPRAIKHFRLVGK